MATNFVVLRTTVSTREHLLPRYNRQRLAVCPTKHNVAFILCHHIFLLPTMTHHIIILCILEWLLTGGVCVLLLEDHHLKEVGNLLETHNEFERTRLDLVGITHHPPTLLHLRTTRITMDTPLQPICTHITAVIRRRRLPLLVAMQHHDIYRFMDQLRKENFRKVSQ